MHHKVNGICRAVLLGCAIGSVIRFASTGEAGCWFTVLIATAGIAVSLGLQRWLYGTWSWWGPEEGS